MVKQFTLFLVPLVMASLTYGENTVDVTGTKAIPADPFVEAIDWFKLQDRNGFTFIPNTETPYSGWAKKTYDNGQFEILAKFENGLITKVQKWQENGLPIWEAEYIPNKNGAAKFITVESEVPIIEGKPQFGTQTKKEWKENPFIGEFPNYEECNGTVKEWFANGQKSWEGEMKDGLDHGLSTEWFENGVKAKETNWLVSTKNGISRSWNESGQINKSLLTKKVKAK